MTSAPLSAVVLAAGHGTRMRSSLPKPLHPICGQAMLLYVLEAALGPGPKQTVVVVGHGAEEVTKQLVDEFPTLSLDFVEQRVQRGTGDAVAVGLTAVGDHDGDVLVLPGDTPLLRPETLTLLVDQHRASGLAATILTAEVTDPTGYGRIVRGRDDRVERIVEEGDASEAERAITEVNTSIYCFRRSLLAPALRRVTADNSQGEYYLTDVIAVLTSAGHHVQSYPVADQTEVRGVNDRAQLADAEAEVRRRINRRWLADGVRIVDPLRTYIGVRVEVGPDVTIHPGVVLEGRTIIAEGATIGPNSHLTDCVVGPGAVVEAATARDAEIGARARVGPYAVVEPGAQIPSGGRCGPFTTSTGE